MKDYGINAIFDENADSNNINQFMVDEIKSSDKIIIVITKKYTEKANQWKGGVGVECKLYFDDVFNNDKKIIPIIKEQTSLPHFLSGIKYVDFSSEGGYVLFDELVKRIKGIPTYKLAKVTEAAREVKPRSTVNPIFSGKKQIESIDVHIIDFKKRIEKCSNDPKKTYDFLFSIQDKNISDIYIPSLTKFYDTRKKNNLLFVEEQILWAEIFSKLWIQAYYSDQGLERLIDLFATKNSFIIKNAFSNLNEIDPDELHTFNPKLERTLHMVLWECIDIDDIEVIIDILCFLFFMEKTEKFWSKFDKVNNFVKEAFFNRHWYLYNRSFGESDFIYLKKYLGINEEIDNYLYNLISKIKSFEAIEVIHQKAQYTRATIFNVLKFIIEKDQKHERNEKIIMKAREFLDSYSNKKYAQTGTDKYLIDFVENIIQKQDVELFISNLDDIHGIEEDLRFLIRHIQNINATKEQRKKINKFLDKCREVLEEKE